MTHESGGIELATWSTLVEQEDLQLVTLSFDPCSPLSPGVSVPPAPDRPLTRRLTATFVSSSRASVIRFCFSRVIAFRVLDENGLDEIWAASAAQPRPARSTFRVRGHGWNRESFLSFLDQGLTSRFSHVVATSDWCLEVVCAAEPVVTEDVPDGAAGSPGDDAPSRP